MNPVHFAVLAEPFVLEVSVQTHFLHGLPWQLPIDDPPSPTLISDAACESGELPQSLSRIWLNSFHRSSEAAVR